MFVGLWWQGRGERLAAALGIASSTLITFLSGSSGPIASYMAAVVGLAMWPLRNYLRVVRWGIVLSLLVTHLVMKAPVWFIFAHIDIMSGSTGWHRSQLIDRTIANFSDWWLVGTKDTIKWGVWAGDITNQFILEGVRGGLITMLLFIAIVVLAFSGVGRAMRAVRGESRRSHLLLWAVGATVFTHVITFLGVSYFDQNVVNWYLALVFAAAAVTVGSQRRAASKQAEKPGEVKTSREVAVATETVASLPVSHRLLEAN